MKYVIASAVFIFTACTTGPSHIPPPHEIPGAVIGGGIENAIYKKRRKKVKTHLAAHLDIILDEADRGGGTHFSQGCVLAKVASQTCTELAAQISSDAHIYRTGTREDRIEALTVAFMVHGD